MSARAHGSEGIRRRKRNGHPQPDWNAKRRVRAAVPGGRRSFLLGPRSRRALSAPYPIFSRDRARGAQAPDRRRSRADRPRRVRICQAAGRHQGRRRRSATLRREAKGRGGRGSTLRCEKEAAMTTRVLIIDDSALMRQLLTSLLSEDPEIEVVDAAPDPFVAREMIKALNPDVVTLDVEMPHMDGLTFLRKIMTLRPMPVVMVSTLTQGGADTTLEALEIGAVDFIAKPSEDLVNGLADLAEELQRKVKAAAGVRVGVRGAAAASRTQRPQRSEQRAGKFVFVGASTGGV